MANIGITGHRILPDIHQITSQVDDVFENIAKAFDRPFNIYCSLAEGADRLVTRHALGFLDAQLIVPLPLIKEDFLTDFSGDSRLEFLELLAVAKQVIELPPSFTRAEAYECAGRFILDNIDVLIAVWNGEPAKGRGGTGQVVAEARARGIPLAWIHTDNRLLETLSAHVSPEKQNITYEHFPSLGIEMI